MVTSRPPSVRARLTLWYASSLAILLLMYAGGVYAWARHTRISELDHDLDQDFELVDDLVEVQADGTARLRELPPGSALDENLPCFEVHAPDGQLLLRHAQKSALALGADQDLLAAVERGPATAQLDPGHSVRREVRTMHLNGMPVLVAAARSQARMYDELKGLLAALSIAIPLVVVLAGLGGYALACRALEPVEQSIEQLRRFTADASHELRTPLTAVRSVGEVGLRGPREPEEYREIIGSMLEEVDWLSRLLDALLMLARADSGSLRPALEACDLAALAREAADQLGVLAEERGQRLSLHVDERLPVRVDRTLVRQAIINLLDNAIKHSPPGTPISIIARADNGNATVAVVDRGPGIAREHQDKIFERFYRVDPARTRAQGGAGLGLALARWTAEAHGGRIEVESAEQQGATFRLVLPSGANDDAREH